MYGKHEKELDRLRDMLTVHLTDASAIEEVLEPAVVVEFDTEPDGSAQREAVATLDAGTVAAGDGAAAFAALRAQFWRLASPCSRPTATL